LVVVLLAALGVAALYESVWTPDAAGETAQILVPGAPTRNISLRDNHRYSVQGPLGDSILEVSDGRIRFVESPCDNKQCIHSGWLARAGDFATCLPNRVSILVNGADGAYDTINF
jgi:hypothetical protein